MSPLRKIFSPRVPLAMLALAVAACTSAPPQPAAPAFDAVAAVAAVHAAGAAGEHELVIKPLGDPEVEDLRAQAVQLHAQGQHADAAAVLDQALAITPDDPALLQERAEAALLQQDFTRAEQLAQRAFAAGAQVGPLCRRHWETIAQARAARVVPAGDSIATVAEARQARDACTVAAPNRY